MFWEASSFNQHPQLCLSHMGLLEGAEMTRPLPCFDFNLSHTVFELKNPLGHFSFREPEGGCGANRRQASLTAAHDGCTVATNGGFFDVHNGDCLGTLISDGKVFMAFQLKSMAFSTKITPYDPYQLKKLWNFDILGFGLWVWPSNFFFGLWRFFWDLWCLTSPVVCKNHMSELYFMPNSFCC